MKWFLAVPHYIALLVLYLGVLLSAIAAWFEILFTGRYPRAIFDFIEGVIRWHNRVVGYAFVLVPDEVSAFPARLTLLAPGDVGRRWLRATNIPGLPVVELRQTRTCVARRGLTWTWCSIRVRTSMESGADPGVPGTGPAVRSQSGSAKGGGAATREELSARHRQSRFHWSHGY